MVIPEYIGGTFPQSRDHIVHFPFSLRPVDTVSGYASGVLEPPEGVLSSLTKHSEFHVIIVMTQEL